MISDSLKGKIEALLNSHPILLFMKGTRYEPQCGFSAHVVRALEECHVPFETFNILEDMEMREGLKAWAKWPTYPQLYVKGELLGGCDIVAELHRKGELQEKLSQI